MAAGLDGVDGFQDPGPASARALVLAAEKRMTVTVADALDRLGYESGEALDRFLEPRLSHLSPPDAMADRGICAERMARAVRAGERIVVFGDYDCDGMTACAILTEGLTAMGGSVTPLLATRREGSYGLSEAALTRVLEATPSLVITCDCGSSDHERLRALERRGIDALVIDHHLVPAEPLPVLGFLNPHRPECAFPFKGMASCGLALSLLAAVRTALGQTYDVRQLLDLVAIGTIADVAPLTRDNRALVRAGLAMLRTGSRPGFRAMLSHAKVNGARALCAQDVSFKIAPRLNAPGRLSDPDIALRIMLERNSGKADLLAAEIEHLNIERRALQARMLAEAEKEVLERRYDRDPAIVLAQVGWHPGVVGIVAGRLCATYGKPVIVAAIEGERARGSVRGPQGVRLYDALSACKSSLRGFGGHQAAAGVDIDIGRIEALRADFCQAFSSGTAEAGLPGFDGPVVRLAGEDRPEDVVRDVLMLEPCGESNAAPLLFFGGVTVRAARNLKGHLKLELSAGRSILSAFLPTRGAEALSLSGSRLDVVGRIRPDDFRGGQAVELQIEAMRRAG